MRDLGELAESHGISAVESFARAREVSLGALDDRTLDVVDAAAQSLVESASTAWARPTPPVAVGVIEVPNAPVVASGARDEPVPAAPAADPHLTPPTGQALVALLETSISGLHAFGDDESARSVPTPEPRDVGGVDGVVSIDALVYRGRAALERARAVRDALRGARDAAPDPAMLDELYDLLDLAALEETTHA
jgi:hypothetical protein